MGSGDPEPLYPNRQEPDPLSNEAPCLLVLAYDKAPSHTKWLRAESRVRAWLLVVVVVVSPVDGCEAHHHRDDIRLCK